MDRSAGVGADVLGGFLTPPVLFFTTPVVFFTLGGISAVAPWYLYRAAAPCKAHGGLPMGLHAARVVRLLRGPVLCLHLQRRAQLPVPHAPVRVCVGGPRLDRGVQRVAVHVVEPVRHAAKQRHLQLVPPGAQRKPLPLQHPHRQLVGVHRHPALPDDAQLGVQPHIARFLALSHHTSAKQAGERRSAQADGRFLHPVCAGVRHRQRLLGRRVGHFPGPDAGGPDDCWHAELHRV